MSVFKEFNNITDLSLKENKMFPQTNKMIFFLNMWEKKATWQITFTAGRRTQSHVRH